MCDDLLDTMTRRRALALVPWLYLPIAGAGCSPARQSERGAAGIPDRLEKMRSLRGTGDPRQQLNGRSRGVRQKSRPR
jgi:hypothetical protein